LKTTNKTEDNEFLKYQDINEFYRKTNLSRNEATEFLLFKLKKLIEELRNNGGNKYE
jgi:hypothetical protein